MTADAAPSTHEAGSVVDGGSGVGSAGPGRDGARPAEAGERAGTPSGEQADEQAPVRVERVEPAIAVVTLARPQRLNALTGELVDLLRTTLTELGRDETVRVVVLTGAGRGFCAGLDLAAAGEEQQDPMAMTSAAMLAGQERFAGMVRAVRSIPQPVIAAVNGAAAGAGMALALAADVRIAAASAVFHVAAVKIGLSAGECGISYHLPRQVGTSRAAEIMLTGRPVDAAEADRIGLVSRVVPDGELLPAALDTARAIVANSPFAVAQTKRVLWANLDVSFDTALEVENRTQILALMTADSREAMRAFVEKRPPVFRGR